MTFPMPPRPPRWYDLHSSEMQALAAGLIIIVVLLLLVAAAA